MNATTKPGRGRRSPSRRARRNTALREALRHADPVTADPRAEERLEQLRGRLLRQARRAALADDDAPRRRPAATAWTLGAWTTVAAAAAVCAGVTIGLFVVEPRTPPGAAAGRAGDLVQGGAADRETRRIDFTTAGGTRIIWVIDPRFDLR